MKFKHFITMCLFICMSLVSTVHANSLDGKIYECTLSQFTSYQGSGLHTSSPNNKRITIIDLKNKNIPLESKIKDRELIFREDSIRIENIIKANDAYKITTKIEDKFFSEHILFRAFDGKVQLLEFTDTLFVGFSESECIEK